LVAEADGNGGLLPPTQKGITLSRKGIEISAFKQMDGGILLRLWEQGGISGKLEVILPAGATFITAIPVNLRGEKSGEPIRITAGKWSFNLPAYAPASFILSE